MIIYFRRFKMKTISQLIAAAWLVLCAEMAMANSLGNSCVADLRDIDSFMHVNDSSARSIGMAHRERINEAFETGVRSALGVDSQQACEQVLRSYLNAWRPGHVGITTTNRKILEKNGNLTADSPSRPSRAPTLEILNSETIVLTFKSFNGEYKDDIEQLLSLQESALKSHPYWIIDLRENDGGNDSTYAPILPWIMSGDFIQFNAQWLATAANISANENICAITGGGPICKKMIEPVLKALRSAAHGDIIFANGESATEIIKIPHLKFAPKRVAVLADKECNSSCEQFLLAAKQSMKIKLFGRPSGGNLDYSNLRPHPLPSGERVLYYATSVSSRLPLMPIDQIGVQPDILLPAPRNSIEKAAEITKISNWLQHGIF